jgi:hypothetical protein
MDPFGKIQKIGPESESGRAEKTSYFQTAHS